MSVTAADGAGRPATPAHRGGSGTPLVLLHGATATWRSWLPVLPALEEEHEVFAPTLPGHWGAVPLAAGLSVGVAALTDAVERELDAIGVETAHLVGNSLGGWIALELARRGRARTVVALSPAGGWRTRRDLRTLAWQTRLGYAAARAVARRPWRLAASPRARRLLLGRTVQHPDRIPAGDFVEMLRHAAACTVLTGLLKSATSDGLLRARLDGVCCPIRIAWPQDDRMTPFERFGRPLLEVIPGAEHVTLAGVGHVPMYDDPALVVRTILDVTLPADRSSGSLRQEQSA